MRHEDHVQSASFSPDGRFLLTKDSALTERIFEASSGRLIGPPMRFNAAIQSAPPFSPDGRRTLTVCYDQTVWVRETTPPGPARRLAECG